MEKLLATYGIGFNGVIMVGNDAFKIGEGIKHLNKEYKGIVSFRHAMTTKGFIEVYITGENINPSIEEFARNYLAGETLK